MFGLFSYDLTDDDKSILKYLATNPSATQTMMAEASGIKLQKVKSILRENFGPGFDLSALS